MRGYGLVALASITLTIACCHCAPSPEGPAPSPEPEVIAASSTADNADNAADSTKKSEPAPEHADEPAHADVEQKPKPSEGAEPAFTDDMSVEQAIKAVPQSADRLNVDQETLGKPLQDSELYAPCKPGSARFTLRVAVWRGKAVGIDLSTIPKNPKLAACIKGRLRAITWPVKVPSLNTVQYSF
jgi:hypothetical protein